MLAETETAVLRITDQPSIGPRLMDMPTPKQPPLDPVVFELRMLRKEILGLREDLASRTWTARWRRFVAWVKVSLKKD